MLMVERINLSLEIGYEMHTIELNVDEWKKINDGTHLIKKLESYYEGESFTYTFEFNEKERYPDSSLLVTYEDSNGEIGDGFIGNIEDVLIKKE